MQALAHRTLLGGLLLAVSASVPAADEVLVAGASGQVFRSEAKSNVFTPLTCACSGPVTAMAADTEYVYTADEGGNVTTFELESGALVSSTSIPVVPTAMVAFRGRLVVADDQGTILRVDPVTGATSDRRAVPTQINAMVLDGEDLFVAGLDGAVYTANVRSGPFTYFTCFCFFDIRAMALLGNELYVGDAFGTVARIDRNTGFILGAFFRTPGFNAFQSQGGSLLVHDGGGVIARLSPLVGSESSYYQAPLPVTAMVVIRERMPAEPVGELSSPKGGVRR